MSGAVLHPSAFILLDAPRAAAAARFDRCARIPGVFASLGSPGWYGVTCQVALIVMPLTLILTLFFPLLPSSCFLTFVSCSSAVGRGEAATMIILVFAGRVPA